MSRQTALLAAASLLLVLLAGQLESSAQAKLEVRRNQVAGSNGPAAVAAAGMSRDSPAPAYEVPATSDETPTCGYASCPRMDPKKLNVHIVAHTHDDVGWLKTVDQYYYGTKKVYSKVGVEYILDSLVPALMMDKSKRFVYVEISFFAKWWADQDESIRSGVRKLVNEGRLEFINGGWCMNDEATVSYHSTIEQMTLGLKFLNETFGACARPKVGWQIDPFGHSNEQASLFAQFGFDGMFFSRTGYLDKFRRTRDKSLDLIWHGDRALPGQSGSIFTNVFRDHYELDLYCFDALCADDAVVDNKNSYEYNVDRLAGRLIDYARLYGESKMTNNILVPFGGDFHFSAAGQNFKSMDRLIKFVRANAPDINIFYSTPSCYQLAVHQALKGYGDEEHGSSRLPEKYDDFMPYDSSATVWWSGYFSSRPSVKLIERETAQMLQVVRQISLGELLGQMLAPTNKGIVEWRSQVELHEKNCLEPLWEILGDLQHHDAVTGTEKQHVADDYERRASDASQRCAKMITSIKRHKLEERLSRTARYEQLRQSAQKLQLDPIYLEGTTFCHSLNISQCEALESDVDVQNYAHLKLVKAHLVASQSQGSSNLSHSAPLKPLTLPKELETKSVLLTIHNPLARPVSQVDIRLPCNGKCELDKIQVVHLGSRESLKLTRLPLPAGIAKLSYRESRTNHEILFYADVPALGSASFLIGDENTDELVDEESSDDVVVITDESLRQNKQNVIRGRRIQRRQTSRERRDEASHFVYFTMNLSPSGAAADDKSTSQAANKRRVARDTLQQPQQGDAADRVVLKFDMRTGMITGLRRASDGSSLNISQRFGQYFPANVAHQPGAYIFRPNSSEPRLFEKPISFKMYKRQGGGLIEIHQKWADWIWQTIRVDSKRNYIEFDYVVGPIPIWPSYVGREVVTRYSTNMDNAGVFLTDSNGRQLMSRHRLNDSEPTQTGGSFYPVVSTLMLRNSRPNGSAEAVAILVDRPQAGTSLNNGDLELLVARRLLKDDQFGVDEALNEPGEDGRGLVTRGKHRLFLKFHNSPSTERTSHSTAGSPSRRQQVGSSKAKAVGQAQPILVELPSTPKQNLTFERQSSRYTLDSQDAAEPVRELGSVEPTYLVHDKLYNDIRQESVMYALRPLLTFDRLRQSASEFLSLLQAANGTAPLMADQSLLNESLPSNIHLLTLQAWRAEPNQLLMRFENLDNPLTVHPMPNLHVYRSLLNSYDSTKIMTSEQVQQEDPCNVRSFMPAQFIDVEYLLKDIRITSLTELNLGANAKLSEDKRLDWTDEERCKSRSANPTSATSIKLGPRQIRTFVTTFELL